MKRFFPIVLILCCLSLFSCDGSRGVEDSVVMEDVFEVDVFKPNNDVKEAIGESLLSLIPNRFTFEGDSICIKIECHTKWNVSENTNPYSIRIDEIDTNLFFLTINEGLDTETTMVWGKPSDRPILRTIKTILDTGTYSLCCINIDDVTPQSILNMYHDFGSIAMTDINFRMCLRNGKD